MKCNLLQYVLFELIICNIPQIKHTGVYYYRDISKANLFGHYLSMKVFTIRTSRINKWPAVAEGVHPKLACSTQTLVYRIILFLWLKCPQWARTSLSRLYNLAQLDAPRSVELLWTSDQLDADTSTWQHTMFRRDKPLCFRLDSYPQSQQVSGRRPRPRVRHNYLLGSVNEIHRFSWCFGSPAQQLLVFLHTAHWFSDLKTVNFETRQDMISTRKPFWRHSYYLTSSCFKAPNAGTSQNTLFCPHI